MQKLNERTLKMMESYVDLHNEGLSVAEIASRFNLSETTVYKRLDEIASRAGVPREDLLVHPFEADHSGRNFTPVKPIDPCKLQKHFESANTELTAIQQEIETSIKELEVMNELLMEEIE